MKCLECDADRYKPHAKHCSGDFSMMHLNRLPDERSRLYYKAHITVEPSEMLYENFCIAAEQLGWRASKFEHDAVDNIEGKWFLSNKNEHSGQLIADLRAMVQVLTDAGLQILRAKIEDTLFDTKYGDEM